MKKIFNLITPDRNSYSESATQQNITSFYVMFGKSFVKFTFNVLFPFTFFSRLALEGIPYLFRKI
jgi:hypothetical protein